MAAGDLGILVAASFWDRYDEWISAALAIAAALIAAYLVNRAFERRWGGPLSREADTRLQFIRRVVSTTILLIGIAVAASQFTGINRLAASILASGAIVAAIIGFAAQRTLGNFVAGVMLAVTQPLRIGDWVTFEDTYGRVEEVRLNFTVLRLPSEARVIIPNERLAGGILRNDTLVIDAVGLDIDVWVPLAADTDAAMRLVREATGAAVSVAEVTGDSVRLAVAGDSVPPPERAAREADLRARCLAALRGAGLLG
jgi:small-conductance mechanosensitive channel